MICNIVLYCLCNIVLILNLSMLNINIISQGITVVIILKSLTIMYYVQYLVRNDMFIYSFILILTG